MKTPCTLGSNPFYNVPTSAKLYVPIGTKSLYSISSGWSRFIIEERIENGDVFTVKSEENVNITLRVTDAEDRYRRK